MTAIVLLTLTSLVMLLAIGLLWTSVRTLTGDVPDTDDDLLHDTIRRPDERKRLLLALKDLERERSLGKMGPEDYEALAANYRDDLKRLMKKRDEELSPFRKRAEDAIANHLAREGAPKEGTDP